MARKLDLGGGAWVVRVVGDLSAVPERARGREFPAVVPGCIHTDLIRAGVIGDPRIGFNERECQWVGEADWEYRRRFVLEPEMLEHERLDLACEGLDTIAEVSLNGTPVGAAANAFHPHRFDLRPAARAGENVLAIVFRSPLRHIRAEEERAGKLPYNGDFLGWAPYVFIRKPAVQFGWDFAPRVAGCGVYGAIAVEAWNGVRIAGVRPLTLCEGEQWVAEVHIDLEWSGSERAPSSAVLGACLHLGARAEEWDSCEIERGATSAVLRLEPDEVRPWWPRGLGAQELYDLDVTLHTEEETAVTAWGRMGFREVRLNTEPDEQGTRFQVEINGKPVFCKGANWVPEGLFPEDRTDARVRERVGQAAAANMNMLRVWGGGAYESAAFYEECDRLGIMVWQDFMFACGCYPEEEPLRGLVETESRHQIARLSGHPSVVLWCGGNECVWGVESWGAAEGAPWRERVRGKTWGAGYWFDLLPRLVRELDPTRPYWANSPWSEGAEANAAGAGDRHEWSAAPGSEAFRKVVPRFGSEFGQQSAPGVETLREAMGQGEWAVGSAGLEHRQRATGGMAKHIDPFLPAAAPATLEAWVSATQEAQAAALKKGVEWLAASRPRCAGALLWQLNDAWPGMSWSLIDAAGRPKPAYFAVREAFGAILP